MVDTKGFLEESEEGFEDSSKETVWGLTVVVKGLGVAEEANLGGE